MPRAATSEELELLRSDGQAAKLRAAFFVPHVIYSAVLASVPSSTDMVAQIAFTSGVGTLANVKQDMLLKVGSTAGGQELGIARIRKAPIAGTFYIGEQSIIDWSAAVTVYLTVVDDFDMHARHVRIDGTAIYMDYDIAFSDQHTLFTPVPVLGPVVSVGKLEGASVTVQVGPETGYQSWVIGSSISSYLWSCATATAISSTSAVRPTMTFNTTGWHLIYCLVTAANGKTRLGVRYVYIWSDAAPPLTVFQFAGAEEDHRSGGFNFNLSFADQASLSEIPDRALCVVFAEDYYGSGDDQQKISIGAVTGRENIIAIGRVMSESLSYDDESSTASIEVQSYHELMKRIQGFPAGLRFKITPAVWTDMPAMNVDRALWHLLEWHTTALTIMDFNPTNDTRRTAQAFSPFSSIWEQMVEFAHKQIVANTHVDHLGRLWVGIDALMLPVADRNYPVVMTLTDGDLTGRVELPREVLSEVGQVNLSGVVIDGGGNATAFFSLSPGHIHDRTGRIDIADRLLLEDQTQANELAGLLFAAKNNPYKPMRIKLRANNRLLTCFPNQAITYTIAADKNPRGFAITKNWIPRQRKLSYDAETGVLEVEFVIEAETTPMHAVVGDVPGSNEFTFPPLPGLPSLPSIPIILPGGIPTGSGEAGPPYCIINDLSTSGFGTSGIGLVYTENFDADDPEFYTINGGLSAYRIARIRRMMRAPNGAIYAGLTSIGGGNHDWFLARAAYPGAAFEIIEDQASINAKMGTTGNNGRLGAFFLNPLYPEYLVYALWNTGTTLKIYRGNYGAWALGATLNSDNTEGDFSYGGGKWVYTGSGGGAGKIWLLNADASAEVSSMATNGFLLRRHVRGSTSGKLFLWDDDGNNIALSSDYGTTLTNDVGGGLYAVGAAVADLSRFAVDPTGTYIATTRATTGKGKSSDGGNTLVDIANLPFTGFNWFFAYAGGAGSSSCWVAAGSYLYYTDDFFNTSPIDKRGNLPDLSPLFQAQGVITWGFE